MFSGDLRAGLMKDGRKGSVVVYGREKREKIRRKDGGEDIVGMELLAFRTLY